MQEPKPGQTTPTNEVGDEGGGPGDIELEQRLVVVTGSEATTTVDNRDRRTPAWASEGL
jgi:hypothetical protein